MSKPTAKSEQLKSRALASSVAEESRRLVVHRLTDARMPIDDVNRIAAAVAGVCRQEIESALAAGRTGT